MEEASELQKTAIELSKDWNKDAYLSSSEFFQNASQIWFRASQPEKASECLREASRLLLILSENEKAKSSLDQALEIDKKTNNLASQAKTLSSLAEIYFTEGNLKNKEFLSEAIKSSKISADFAAQATTLFVSASFLFEQDDPELTLKTFLEALSFAEKANEGRLIAKIQTELSYAYFKLGKYDLALEMSKNSLLKWQELGDKRNETIAQIAIGFHYRNLGKAQIALNQFLLAEKNFPTDLDFIEKARLFAAISAIYGDFGDNSKLEENLISAYNLYQKAGYTRGQLAILPSLVETSFLGNKPEKANTYYQEIQSLSKILNDDFYLGYTSIIIGNEKLKENLPLIAIDYFNLALKVYSKYKNQQGLALIYQRLGESYKKAGLLKESKKSLLNSLSINQKSRDRFNEAATLLYLAQIFQLEKSDEKALDFTRQSLELTEFLYTDVAQSNLKRTYFSSVYDRYELYINLLMQKHKELPNENFAIQALMSSEKSRSRSLLETLRLSEVNLTKDADPELLNKENELRSLLNLKADKLTQLLSSGTDKTGIAKFEDEIRGLENELENVKAELKQKSPIYSAIKNPPPFDITQFQQNILDDNTVLLEFSLGEKESYLWLVGKNEVSTFILPARNIIENRIDRILQTFEKRQLAPNEEIEAFQKRMDDLENIFNQETKLLSQDLLGPTVEKIRNKRLIIVPDGKLHYLPFSALPSPDSDELLITNHEIIHQPSASILTLLASLDNPHKVKSKDLLIFADPIFSDDDPRLVNKTADETFIPQALGLDLRDFRLVGTDGKISRLFASQVEADSIVKTIGKDRATLITGYQANRERVLNSDISDYRILHFATHGLVDVERPEISSIVLSQFDETGQKREGFLRLQDIYALNLTSDLVVLSACQSGVGKEVKGEGLMSLNNAFLQAGAKTVLSSAWKVDDNATAELMKNFYANLFDKGLTPSEALRRAQLTMSKTTNFKSPFYWAAFTVQGEYRQPISFSASYFYHLVTTAVVAILIGGWLWRTKVSKPYRTAKK